MKLIPGQIPAFKQHSIPCQIPAFKQHSIITTTFNYYHVHHLNTMSNAGTRTMLTSKTHTII